MSKKGDAKAGKERRLDPLTVPQRSERMARVRGKDTKPELRVRRLVHSLGYRYRLHSSKLPGKPDLVFASRRKVIFVHGCFWHRHRNCARARFPKTRPEFWVTKLEGNARRDHQNQRKLRELGYDVLVVWECQTLTHVHLRESITTFLEGGTCDQ